MNNNVRVEIVNDITPEVIEGLNLFAKYAYADYNTSNWLHWFKNNPYNRGLHIIATHQEKIIGYYSLIPIEMQLSGKTLIGAKGEFLVVDPDYRKSYVSSPRIPLAFDLVKIINKEAIDRGIKAILANASGAAALCHESAGAKKIKYPSQQFFTFFNLPEKGIGPRNSFLIKSKFYSVARLPLRIKSIVKTNKQKTFEIVDYLNTENLNDANNSNRLISQNSEMLNFRFPSQEYIKYLLHSEKKINYLIFKRPGQYKSISLRDWSSLNLQKSEFEDVFIDLFSQCKKYGVELLNMNIPNNDQKITKLLHSFGFLSRNYTSELYISGDDDLMQNLKDIEWDFTNAHTEYI